MNNLANKEEKRFPRRNSLQIINFSVTFSHLPWAKNKPENLTSLRNIEGDSAVNLLDGCSFRFPLAAVTTIVLCPFPQDIGWPSSGQMDNRESMAV